MAVFGVSPGADFVACLHDHILALADGKPPQFLPSVHVLVPSRRMQRRLKSIFDQSGNHLLPRIGLVSDVTHLLPEHPVQRRVSDLRRILDLKPVVSRLVDLDPRLSRSDVIDLTTSLTGLLDEMHGEGVGFDALESLAADDQSGHWDQSLSFLSAIRGYVESLDSTSSDGEAIHRADVTSLAVSWAENPHKEPIIIAGSTGSRATTAMLMEAVARLPNGMVLLPGFDFDLPDDIWDRLNRERRFEDHPQFRFARFLKKLDLGPRDVCAIGAPPDPLRNRLISLALRPAPVTDQWLVEGPALGALRTPTQNLTLIEAREPKDEATAIAVAMRSAAGKNHSVALIAPDATLARRVTAELSRWGIVPDDSGGTPLSLTPIGRFLRQTARFAGGQRDPVELMSLLKHPMTSAGDDRGAHMLSVQEFELFLRRKGIVEVTVDAIEAFSHETNREWCSWLASALAASERLPEATTLTGALNHHMTAMRAFSGTVGWEVMFDGDDGEKIAKILREFGTHADHGTSVDYAEYLQILERVVSAESARVQQGVRPDVMIWGTLEARVQGAEVVILGGLNEGVWPEQLPADPWLNRAMRRQVGLLLPERQIGLAAHDFQQAVGASQVILSRSARSEGSETVPSRWLSRLTNLLNGLIDTDGANALADMRKRGNALLRHAATLDQPDGDPKPEKRPAPAPPVSSRPRDFAVTEIQRLIRDPYAIYARRILRLRPLDPLFPEMDGRRKGTVFHAILEQFYNPDATFDEFDAAYAELTRIMRKVFDAQVPDATTRVVWGSQLTGNARWLFESEVERRRSGRPLLTEVPGVYTVPGTSFSLRGKADRIDRLNTGDLVIYDYKTGSPPSRADIRRYDRQLILEAAMAEDGAFENLPPAVVDHVVHLGVGRTPKAQITELTGDNETVTVPSQVAQLLSAYLVLETGYLSRRAMEDLRYAGDYDHLARFGEWDASEPGHTERVG